MIRSESLSWGCWVPVCEDALGAGAWSMRARFAQKLAWVVWEQARFSTSTIVVQKFPLFGGFALPGPFCADFIIYAEQINLDGP